jgi:hypothetical protein
MNNVEYINLCFQKPFIPPLAGKVYKKRTFTGHTRAAGCYMIKENDKIVYIGMSQSCVVEALYRHFYEWNDKRGNDIRVTYYDRLLKKKYTAVIIITTKEQAPLFEQSLIVALQPRDNKEMYKELISIRDNAPQRKEDDDLPF